MKSIGYAIGKIYREMYKENSDKRYQSPIDRVLMFNVGVSSFFYRMYDNTLKPKWPLHVLTTILREANLIDLVGTHNPDWNEQSLIAEKLSEIHKTIQGGEIAITTEGLKTPFIPLLVTNYNLTEQEITKNKENLINQITSLGIDIDNFRT